MMFNFPTVKILCNRDIKDKNGKAIFVAGRMYHVNMKNKSPDEVEIFSENKKWIELHDISRPYDFLFMKKIILHSKFKKAYKNLSKAGEKIEVAYLTEDKNHYFVYNRQENKFLLVPKSYIQI